MEFTFEVRSKTYTSRTWANTAQFCIDHDHWIPMNYQKRILEIASDYGVYRKIEMLDDGKGMLLYARLPTPTLFSEWLAKRIDYFHEVNNSETEEDIEGDIPYFPNSFQKRCWQMSNFSPLIPYDIFWEKVHTAFDLAEHECKLNLDTFSVTARKAYHDLYS